MPAVAAQDAPAHTSTEGRLRGVLWAVASAVYVGAAVELALVEHWAEWEQWIALVAVGVALAATASGWRRPSAGTLRAVRVASGAVLAVSVLGVGFHLWGNFEFSLEVSPGDTAAERLWDTLSGGNPAFAPGMLAVAAALSLAAAWRHPGRAPEAAPSADGPRSARARPTGSLR